MSGVARARYVLGSFWAELKTEDSDVNGHSM